MSGLGIFIKGPLVHLLLPGLLLATALIFTPLMQLQTYVLAVIDTERRYVSHRFENKHKCLICSWSIKSAGRRREKKTDTILK